jgi:hypothetical protein
MGNTFISRRISATATTLRRVISDAPTDKSVVQTADVASEYRVATQPMGEQTVPRPAVSNRDSIQPLILQSPLALSLDDETEDDNAFADIGGNISFSAANSTVEPVITKSNLLLLTEKAVEETVDSLAPDRIQRLIEEITPVRIANIFAENSEEFVGQAVTTFAPAQINTLVEKLAPAIIEAEVEGTVREKIVERLSDVLPGGMEASVARVVKDEMQGAFGYTVTRKIRHLVREELRIALSR